MNGLTFDSAIVSIATGETVGLILICLWLAGRAIVNVGCRWSRRHRLHRRVRETPRSGRIQHR